MIYKIVVDKQPMTNPSEEKKEYTIDIDELHFKRDVYDSLVITHDEDYVIRRLELNEYNVLIELNPPIKEPLEDVNIKLFEGENYIYLYDMTGNRIVAQYLVKNDFNELYVIYSEMNSAIEQSAKAIELSVNGKIARVDGDIKDLSANLELKIDKDDNDQIISMINASADRITLSAGRLVINSGNFKLDENGNVKCTNGEFQGNITLIAGNDISIQAENNMKTMSLDYTGLAFYDYNNNVTDTITRTNFSNKLFGTSVLIKDNSYFAIEKDIGNTRYQLMNFNDINSTPYIRNTANGTLFPNNSSGGVKIENGLITNWNITGTICDLNNVTITGIKVRNGLIEDITYHSN